MDIDGLWETYHHIKKLDELEQDERGNRWNQGSYGDAVWTTYGSRVSLLPGEYLDGKFCLNIALRELQDINTLCGTGMCFAGWYCALKGLQIDGAGATIFEGRWRHVSAVSDILAGVPLRHLFASGNDLSDIREILINITGVDRG